MMSSSTKPAADDLADPVAERAVMLDVGGRRRSRRTRRRAAGRSTSAPRPGHPRRDRRGRSSASDGSPRTPSARRASATRNTSRITAAESSTNGTAPNAVKARSNALVAYGQPHARPLARAVPRTPVDQPAARACRNMPADRSSATTSAPWVASHRARGRGTAPDLEDAPAARRRRAGARRPRAAPRGTRRKSTSPRNVAVFGLVGVGVGDPTSRGWRARLSSASTTRRVTPG